MLIKLFTAGLILRWYQLLFEYNVRTSYERRELLFWAARILNGVDPSVSFTPS